MVEFLKYFKYRVDYNYAHILRHKVPIDIMLELSSHCNMRCSYCYHADQDNLPFQKNHMPLDIAKKIIKDAAENGVKSLKFNYKGESSLNPNYFEITTYARSFRRGSTFIDLLANSNFKFPTNREDIFLGLCNLTKVKISYDSFTPDVFETQRAGGIHALTTANIDKFYNHPSRIKNETKMVIQAVRSHLNKDEDIYSLSKARWPDADVSIRDAVGGRVAGFEAERKRDASNRQACRQSFARLVFTSDGFCQVCCPDLGGKLKIGHINESTVYELFNSYKAKKIRAGLKNKSGFDSDPCKTCSSFESYKNYKPSWDS
jgi:radical SAM protein with 4Fe4S-binding SPASM domain